MKKRKQVDAYCYKHADPLDRVVLDDFIEDLPKNQAGKGMHKCPYCAYWLGYEHGKQEGYTHAQRVLEQHKDG